MSAVPSDGDACDPVQRSAEIRSLVANNDVQVAIRKLMDFTRDFSRDRSLEDESVVVSMEWHQIEAEYRREGIDFDKVRVARRRVVTQMLGLLHAVESGMGGPGHA